MAWDDINPIVEKWIYSTVCEIQASCTIYEQDEKAIILSKTVIDVSEDGFSCENETLIKEIIYVLFSIKKIGRIQNKSYEQYIKIMAEMDELAALIFYAERYGISKRLKQYYVILEELVQDESNNNSFINIINCMIDYACEALNIKPFIMAKEFGYFGSEKAVKIDDDYLEELSGQYDEPNNEVDKDEVELFDSSLFSVGVKKIFDNNPYLLLGISVKSDRKSIIEATNKFEKLERIGAIDIYKSEYDLENILYPSRRISNIQIALSTMNSLESKWLWFESADYAKTWYRYSFNSYNDNRFGYDNYLACYYRLLIMNQDFSDYKEWSRFIEITDKLFNEEHIFLFIEGHISEEDVSKYNSQTVVNSFKETICKVIIENLSVYDDIEIICSALEIFEKCSEGVGNSFREKAIDSSLKWLNSKVEIINKANSLVANHDEPDEEEIQNVIIEAYSIVDYLIEKARFLFSFYEDEYVEMYQGKIKKVLWSLGYILWKGNKNNLSANTYSYIYEYCNKDEREQIRNTFSIVKLKLTPKYCSGEECFEISETYRKKGDWEESFKWMLEAGEKGYIKAFIHIARVYLVGKKSVEKDIYETLRWLEKGVEKNDIECISELADFHFRETLFVGVYSKNKAKDLLIKLICMRTNTDDYDKLDEIDSEWKEKHYEALSKLADSDHSIVENLVNIGVLDAIIEMADRYYNGRYVSKDIDIARRLYLRAALIDKAIVSTELMLLFSIDVNETSDAMRMHNIAVALDNNSEHNKDLKFYWYRRAVNCGNHDSYNNLGVCYNDGIGTEQDYEIANELFLKALESGNSGGMRNYGVNLYYGNGVKQDRNKAKEYLILAKNNGNKSAEEFLKDKYGYGDECIFDKRLEICNGGLQIELTELSCRRGQVSLEFSVINNCHKTLNVWIRNVYIDTELDLAIKNVCEVMPFENSKGKVTLERKVDISDINTLQFELEIDDDKDEELTTLRNVRVTFWGTHNLYVPAIDGGAEYFDIFDYAYADEYENEEDDDEYGEDEYEQDYDFAFNDFNDIEIFDSNGFRLEFCGFKIEDYDDIKIVFWAANHCGRDITLWLKNLLIDDKANEQFLRIGSIGNDHDDYMYYTLKDLCIEDDFYDIEFSVEIDEDNIGLDISKYVSARLDLAEKELRTSVYNNSDSVFYDGIDEKHTESNLLYVPGSHFELNDELNGIELYFPRKPSAYVRNILKNNGWRWLGSKSCWYNRNNATNIELAFEITEE